MTKFRMRPKGAAAMASGWSKMKSTVVTSTLKRYKEILKRLFLNEHRWWQMSNKLTFGHTENLQLKFLIKHYSNYFYG